MVSVLPPVGVEGKAIGKTYGTFRNDLIRMRVWLKQLKVTEIAMESTTADSFPAPESSVWIIR